MQKKKKEHDRAEEKEGGDMRQERKIYFLYVGGKSKVNLQTELETARNLGTCCCV